MDDGLFKARFFLHHYCFFVVVKSTFNLSSMEHIVKIHGLQITIFFSIISLYPKHVFQPDRLTTIFICVIMLFVFIYKLILLFVLYQNTFIIHRVMETITLFSLKINQLTKAGFHRDRRRNNLNLLIHLDSFHYFAAEN